ncbi:MAG TPA: nitroreductase/quinone reductase family protein [Jiangellaceae bacterium]
MSTGETPTTRGKQPWLNRAMSRLVRSRFSRLVDRSILLLTVFGRRTGRPYTFPVQYVQHGDVLWVYIGSSEDKTWWRNLEQEARVQVLLRGRERTGRGVAYTYDRQPGIVADGLRRYIHRFPSTAKRLGIPQGDNEALAHAAARSAVVRVHLES